MKSLTAVAIKNLKPRGKEYVVSIPQVPNLGVRVKPSGAKAFTMAPRLHGKQIRMTYPGRIDNLSGAMRWALDVNESCKRGIDPHPPARAPEAPASPLLEDVLEQYLRRQVRPRLKGAHKLEVALQCELQPWLKRPIAGISRADVHARCDAILDRTQKGVAANRFLSHFGTLCAFAVEREIITVNPCAGIRRPAAEKPRDRVLSIAELVNICRASDDLDTPASNFIKMLLLTAARRREVSNMRGSEVDLTGALWTIPASRSKNGRPHTIPLSDLAVEILFEIQHVGTPRYVFSLAGAHGLTTFDKTKKQINELLPRDMQPWVFHDLRRSVATHMAEDLGISPHVVDACLGHTTGSRIARTYNRASYTAEMRTAFAAWGRHIEALVYGTPDKIVALRR